VLDFFEPARDAHLGGVSAPDRKTGASHEKLQRIAERRYAHELDSGAGHEPELHDAAAERSFASHELDRGDIAHAERGEVFRRRLAHGSFEESIKMKLKIKFKRTLPDPRGWPGLS
jgi:hypothetical protein